MPAGAAATPRSAWILHLAVENGDLEGELRASRARILEAGNSERRRIERDLHDSTQQRLVALRVHLTLASEQLDGSEQTTVYFCCLECLQNAAKHAGRGASATVRLFQDDGHVSFTVEDDGAGFDPGTAQRGNGLTNLADRVAAVGGTLTIDSANGQGTRVTANIPV